MSHIKRLLVPTDFSAASDQALDYAIELAQRLGAAIHVMHVLEEPSYATVYPDAYFLELRALHRRMTEDAETRLAAAAARCAAAQVAATTHVMFGKTSSSITQQALLRGTDIIVMGTHGRTGVAHLVLGSVAEHLVRTAPCPVLTVRDTARVADALYNGTQWLERAMA